MKILSFIILIFMLFGCEKKEEFKVQTTPNLESSTETEKVIVKPKIEEPKILTFNDIEDKSYEIEKLDNGFKFKGFEDKIILLDFFATWCPPCKAEIPHLINIKNEYKKDFEIISVLLENDKPLDEIKEFAKKYKINYIVLNSENNEKLAKWVGGVRSLPFMVMYDKKGKYFTHYMGAIPEEMIVSDLKRALKK